MNKQKRLSALNYIRTNKSLYMLMIPVLVYYFVFSYIPMYGAVIAFKNFQPGASIFSSPWVGFQNFIDFFTSPLFPRLMTNTLLISIYSLVFGFPIPIILALSINELVGKRFKRVVQTATYLPHFISMVVVCGIIRDFTFTDGVINQIITQLGGAPIAFLQKPEYFRPIYVITGIWQSAGWSSIIYLSALAGIDKELFDAAKVDGANKFRQILHVSIPSLMPTIITLFILNLGSMLSVGSEKILLLYNPAIYETADVISTYVYRKGLLDFSWSFSAAVGLFNSVVNFSLVVVANKINQKTNNNSLW